MNPAVQTLYEKLGGEETIVSIVEEFTERMLNDDRINHHFIGANMDLIRKHQIAIFMSFAQGGPLKYEGAGLRFAHAGLQITSDEYDIAIQHLKATLKKFNIAIAEIAKMEAFLRSIKPHIVNK
jgi:hemoglobin